MKDDTVRRQDVIDAMCKLMNSWFGSDPKDEQEEITWIINHLPSAQPERKVEKTLAEEVERIKREITDIFDEQMGVQPEEYTKERTETHACDKEKLLSILESAKDKNGEIPMSLVRKAFEQLPSAQTEIILCKDCKYWEYDTIFADGWCRGKHQGNPDWYCADAERGQE